MELETLTSSHSATVIKSAMSIIEEFEKKFPCHENYMIMYHLKSAMDWIKIREKRETEGKKNEV